MNILGIETSCDETAVAVYGSERGLIANHVYTQIPLHQQYGGVVPEIASRDHIRKLLPLIQQTLSESHLSKNNIDGIAYTQGPGLIGALMVGASVAKGLAYSWNVPSLGIHHMEAHLMAVMLEEIKPEFPFLALLVSGGHTLLIHVRSLGQYEILGESLDDAVGEAFDKTAKLLGLPYPGGAALAKLAQQGDPKRFVFPRPMMGRSDLHFSFSGMKTFAANLIRETELTEKNKADIAASFEAAIISALLVKCQRALEQTHLKNLVIAGGVSANQLLRQRLQIIGEKNAVKIFYPQPAFCTDNAAMVAYTGWARMQKGQRDADFSIQAKPRWPMDVLTSQHD